jgi:hypothetical protein
VARRGGDRRQGSLAGGEADVVDVEADDLADARAGVERDEREGLVARRWAALDGSQVSVEHAGERRQRQTALYLVLLCIRPQYMGERV